MNKINRSILIIVCCCFGCNKGDYNIIDCTEKGVILTINSVENNNDNLKIKYSIVNNGKQKIWVCVGIDRALIEEPFVVKRGNALILRKHIEGLSWGCESANSIYYKPLLVGQKIESVIDLKLPVLQINIKGISSQINKHVYWLEKVIFELGYFEDTDVKKVIGHSAVSMRSDGDSESTLCLIFLPPKLSENILKTRIDKLSIQYILEERGCCASGN
ncbi:MAG: hypothetical protein JEZ07_18760 [Phycisphaerae bacterium]|nr:hypothetical protein [Phycisphaerae bacterium]